MLKRGFPSKRLISQVPAVSFPPGYWWQWAGARLAGSLRIRNKHQRLKVAPAHSGCSWPRQVSSNWLRKPQEISHSRYRYPKWPLCFWKNPLKLERYCWRKKSCTTWDVQNPRNWTFTISTGAGFLPSTVPFPNEPFFFGMSCQVYVKFPRCWFLDVNQQITLSRVIFWIQQWVRIWATSIFLRGLSCITGAAEFFSISVDNLRSRWEIMS